MGFQTGSKIDPRLGALDYSGYAKAGAIQGEAMADLGKDLGKSIEETVDAYQTNKEVTSTTLASIEGSLVNNPQYLDIAKSRGGKVGKAAESFLSGDFKQIDLMVLNGFIGAMDTGNAQAQAAQKAADERDNLIARTGASNRSNQPQQITAGTLNSITQSMADSGIKLDAETGQYYREDTGVPMWPFDNKNVPVNFDVKGASDYSKIYGNPDASQFNPGASQFNPDEWQLVN